MVSHLAMCASFMGKCRGSDMRGRIRISGRNMCGEFPGGIVMGRVGMVGMWLAYSVNKEDIWVSRIPVPLQTEGTGWNFYVPKWADASVDKSDDQLRLEDHDPYDYARADRVSAGIESGGGI